MGAGKRGRSGAGGLPAEEGEAETVRLRCIAGRRISEAARSSMSKASLAVLAAARPASVRARPRPRRVESGVPALSTIHITQRKRPY